MFCVCQAKLRELERFLGVVLFPTAVVRALAVGVLQTPTPVLAAAFSLLDLSLRDMISNPADIWCGSLNRFRLRIWNRKMTESPAIPIMCLLPPTATAFCTAAAASGTWA